MIRVVCTLTHTEANAVPHSIVPAGLEVPGFYISYQMLPQTSIALSGDYNCQCKSSGTCIYPPVCIRALSFKLVSNYEAAKKDEHAGKDPPETRTS